MPERLRRLRAPRVVRPVADWDGQLERKAYRIEWQDGRPTGTGLFISPEWAQAYAERRGWMLDIGHEEECA